MPIFTKNDDGEYVEVDEHEFVKGHDMYSKLLEESIDRRKKLTELKAKLAEKEADPVTPAPEPTPAAPPVAAAPFDVDKLFEEFRARLDAERSTAAKREQERKDALAKLAKDKGLGERVLPILEKSADPEETADLLMRSGFRFDSATGGTTGGETSSGVSMDKILKQMGIGGS
jgi:hypothetical protein